MPNVIVCFLRRFAGQLAFMFWIYWLSLCGVPQDSKKRFLYIDLMRLFPQSVSFCLPRSQCVTISPFTLKISMAHFLVGTPPLSSHRLGTFIHIYICLSCRQLLTPTAILESHWPWCCGSTDNTGCREGFKRMS